MIHIPWKDRYNINYKDIDDQHRGLVGILNELADLQGQDMDADRVADIFHRLCRYALTHFATEERYMAAAGYPDLARHQAEHAAFISDLLELNQSFEPGDPRLVEATFSFVKDWYLGHIIRSDLDYVACLKGYHGRASAQGILFDLEGVVCTVHEARFLEAVAPVCGRSAGELQALIASQPSLFRGYETGLLDSREFLERFSELCGRELPAAAFGSAYARVFSPLEPVLAIIRRLKPRYKLGLLADTTPLRFEQGLSELDLLPLFDAVTLSYEVGAVSPDPRLWDDAVARLDLLAEECLHVRARPSVALAPTGHLLHGIVGSSAVMLQANLRRVDVEL